MFLNVISFAIVYFLAGVKNNFSESLTHSMFVFATIGYEQVSPLLQYVIAAQAITGIILTGLFLSALVNKVRY
jgi:hypothetical protein